MGLMERIKYQEHNPQRNGDKSHTKEHINLSAS
jgi:hypothetical protein